MNKTQKIISYLTDCYKAEKEKTAFKLLNFFDRRIEHRCFIRYNDELLTSVTGKDFLHPETNNDFQHLLSIESGNKKLYYFSVFLTGIYATKPLCAPLIYYPAYLSEKGQIKIDRNKQLINFPLLIEVSGKSEERINELLLLKNPSEGGKIKTLSAETISQTIKHVLPKGIDFNPFKKFPIMEGPGVLRKESKKEGLKLFSASALAITDGLEDFSYILSELIELTQKKSFSIPFELLLEHTEENLEKQQDELDQKEITDSDNVDDKNENNKSKKFILNNIFKNSPGPVCFIDQIESLITEKSESIRLLNGKEGELRTALRGINKGLLYFSFFVAGKFEGKTYCAPLLIYPAELTRSEGLTVHIENQYLNYPFIQKITGLSVDKITSTKKIFSIDPLERVITRFASTVEDVLESIIPKVNYASLKDYPLLHSEKDLMFKSEDFDDLHLIPASAVGVANKLIAHDGVLYEKGRSILDIPFLSALKSKKKVSEKTTIIENSREIKSTLFNSSNAFKQSFFNAINNSLSITITPPESEYEDCIASIVAEHVAENQSVLIMTESDLTKTEVDKAIQHISDSEIRVIKNGKYPKQKIKSLPENPNELAINFLNEKADNIKSEIYTKNQKIENYKLLWGYINKINQIEKRNSDRIFQLLHTLKELNTIKAKRFYEKHLEFYAYALSRVAINDIEYHFEQIDFTHILDLFPVWMLSPNQLKELIPLNKNLFDLLIIENANNFDLATLLPAIFRSKRVLFMGDPFQYTLKRNLDVEDIFKIQLKHKLKNDITNKWNFIDKSIYDIADETVDSFEKITLLDESMASTTISKFSNHKFYSDSLVLMNELQQFEKRNLKLIECDGERSQNGVNKKEAEKIVSLIEDLSFLNNNPLKSIGVISPILKQAEYINRLIQKKLSKADIHNHKIKVGTLEDFINYQSDIILISFAADNKTRHQYFNQFENNELFNTLITRAIEQQYLIISFNFKSLPKDSYLQEYFQYINNGYFLRSQKQSLINEVITEHEKVKFFKRELTNKGYELINKNIVAGLEIDVIFKTQSSYFGIDFLNYPGKPNSEFRAEEYRLLYRAGLILIPVPFKDIKDDYYGCARRVETLLKDFVWV